MSIEDEATGHARLRRIHLPNAHLQSAFGNDWFGKKAEDFARFFGTPTFLVAQTIIVALWILVNAVGWTQFDVYPFILLNLAFSTQAAYAAPLILLAQTRQADRDKVTSLADAQHREELHQISEQRQEQARRAGRYARRNAAAEHRADRARGDAAQAEHRTHADSSNPRRADRRDDERGPCAHGAGRRRLSVAAYRACGSPLLVDELDRLLERGGRNLEEASIGHAEFENEKDRKCDRQRAEG